MKSNFLKAGLFLALALTVTVFYSCSDDDDGGGAFKIKASNVSNSLSQVVTVKGISWSESTESYGVIAEANYQNKGFTLSLPTTLADKYLVSLGDDMPASISVSDANAKTAFLEYIEGYDEDDDYIGDFYLEKSNDDSEYYTSWVYADRSVTIKGEVSVTEDDEVDVDKFDVKLKKGWNVIYDTYTYSYNSSTGITVYTTSNTSKKPSGVNYAWYFYNYSAAKTAAKPVENTQSFFSKLKGNRRR